jgi:hypothetical protein
MVMKTKLFLTGLALVAFSALAMAQNPGPGKGKGVCDGTGKGPAYVDSNANGICDNFENGTASAVRKGRNAANCNGEGPGKGKGRNYSDANKNGVCDTFEATPKK